MKIMITGCAGFIGSNLAKSLLVLGHEVVGIDNLSHGYLRNVEPLKDNPNFVFVCGDIANPLILNPYKVDAVVHLASQKIPRYSNALRTLEENYLMLRNVIHKCLSDKSKIVFASTSDVYGKNPKLPFNEESDLVLGPTTVRRWTYASSKLYGEQYIIANHEEYGLEYTIMRFFGSYGPHQNTSWWGGPQAVFIQNILEGKPIELHGDGKQTRTFTYVEDTVQGIIKCLTEKASSNEIFNIAAQPTEEITIAGLAELIIELMGAENKPAIKYIPYSAFGKYEDPVRRVPDITKIIGKLGFHPQYTLREGLKRTIAWQRSLHALAAP